MYLDEEQLKEFIKEVVVDEINNFYQPDEEDEKIPTGINLGITNLI